MQKARFAILASLVLIFCHAQEIFARDTAVALNLKNPNNDLYAALRPYMISLRQRIEQNWHPNSLTKDITVKVHFQVTPRGELINPTILRRSSEAAIDQSAMASITAATPVSPPPQPGGLHIDAT